MICWLVTGRMDTQRFVVIHTMDCSPLTSIPDELVEKIAFYLSPESTVAYGKTCRRINRVSNAPRLWRQHCMENWYYWDPKHNVAEKLQLPATQTEWRQLYKERRQTEIRVLEVFEAMIRTGHHRISRMEEICGFGYDVKEVLVRLRHSISDEADDALSRAYWVNYALGQIHRTSAIETWKRLRYQPRMKVEEALAAFDTCILAENGADWFEIERELDGIANKIKANDPIPVKLSVRQKAVKLAQWMHSNGLVGKTPAAQYKHLQNNFLTSALYDQAHPSMPLQAVAIYCALASRFGINARPSNYPWTSYVVIEAPPDRTLNGKRCKTDCFMDSERMYMDPWASSCEVPKSELTLRLSQMGAPASSHARYLGPTSTVNCALRAARNIMSSVNWHGRQPENVAMGPTTPEHQTAWYGVLWARVVLESCTTLRTTGQAQQSFPELSQYFCAHFPEDLGLIQRFAEPLHAGSLSTVIRRLIDRKRQADMEAPIPKRRTSGDNFAFKYRVGQYFRHLRIGYFGMIIGWDRRRCPDPVREGPVDEAVPFDSFHRERDEDELFYKVVYVHGLLAPCPSIFSLT